MRRTHSTPVGLVWTLRLTEFQRAMAFALGAGVTVADCPRGTLMLAAAFVCTAMSSPSGVVTPAESPVTPNVDQPSVNIGRALKVIVPLPLGPTEMAAFEFVAHTQANAAVRERMIFFAIGLFVLMVWFS